MAIGQFIFLAKKLKKTLKIAILAPFTIVKEFHYPLIAVAKTLRRSGFEILMIHCHQAMQKDCTAMLAKGLNYGNDEIQRKNLCRNCVNTSKLSAKLYPWKTVWLNIAKEEKKEISTIKKIKIKNSELKKMAGYEIVVNKKIHKKSSDEKVINAWNARYEALQNIEPQAVEILKNQKIKALISYNNLYGVHHLFHKICERLKIKSLCLHQSFHMLKNDEFIIFQNTIADFLKEIRTEVSKNIKVPRTNRKIINEHMRGLFASKKPWAYSTPKSERQLRSIAKNKKILVALSSPDEVVGFDLLGLLPKIKNPFKNQILWLNWILKLAKKFPEIKFYIRPHPRLYPNKREATLSEFSTSLEKIRRQDLPKNVEWPPQESQVSIWDHLNDTSILFNAWSSVAEIFSYHKIPTFTFFPKYSNTQKVLGFTSSSRGQYEIALRKALFKTDHNQVKKQAFRWLDRFLTTNTFTLQWKHHWLTKLLLKIYPKKYKEIIESSLFSLAKIVKEKKLIKIIQNEIKK